MGLSDDCKQYFGTNDLYEILDIKKTSTESEIKSAYRKLSLKVHPDRAEDEHKQVAKRAFQTLSKVHFILNDKDLRRTYDETGIIATDESVESDADWDQYWRLLFPKITVKDIDTFMNKYIGSEDERSDLKKVYIRFKGDLDLISQSHIGYDEDRTRELLNQMIEDQEVPEFAAFVNESEVKKNKRIKKYSKEKKLAEKEKKRVKPNVEESDLAIAIQSRSKAKFDDMIAGLEAKYSTTARKSKSKSVKRSNR